MVHTIPAHAKYRPGYTPVQPRMEHNSSGLGPGRSLSDLSIYSIFGPAKMIQRPIYPVGESDHIDISMVQFKENICGFRNYRQFINC